MTDWNESSPENQRKAKMYWVSVIVEVISLVFAAVVFVVGQGDYWITLGALTVALAGTLVAGFIAIVNS